MKKYIIVSIVFSLSILTFLTACQNDAGTTVTNTGSPSVTSTTVTGNNNEALIPIPEGYLSEPTGPEAPDDIVHTPGGDAYRANVHQEGIPDKWPSIQTVIMKRDNMQIQYREDIETKAGETRKNIITVYGGEALIYGELTLYSSVVSDGIKLTDVGGGGRPGILLHILAIEILPGVSPGQYTFQIGIQIDGEDYGTIPCTLQVIE